jgi:hypothetical protein
MAFNLRAHPALRTFNVTLRFPENVLCRASVQRRLLDVLITNLVDDRRLAANLASDRYRFHIGQLLGRLPPHRKSNERADYGFSDNVT